jgi:hypothetical protein
MLIPVRIARRQAGHSYQKRRIALAKKRWYKTKTWNWWLNCRILVDIDPLRRLRRLHPFRRLGNFASAVPPVCNQQEK